MDHVIIYGHVIRDRALVEFSFRAREGLLGYHVNVLFVLPSLVLNFLPVSPI